MAAEQFLCYAVATVAAGLTPAVSALQTDLTAPQPIPPDGFTALFDGQTLKGWKALVGSPLSRAAMSDDGLGAAQTEADQALRRHWQVEGGEIVNDGQGPHLCTDEEYRDFELLIDWKIAPGGDSGVYISGSPQIQIWDPVHGNEQARVGSGGLYNNQRHPSRPLLVADRAAGEWNTFHIQMVGERVTVLLNGTLIVDDVVMENYWDRSRPIFPRGQIELQTHGGELRFRNIFIREITPEEANRILQATDGEGFDRLFNGHDLTGWTGSTDGYLVADGNLVCDPARGGVLMTKREFDNFVLRFEFKLPPGGNNGLAVRTPLGGNPAYDGMEIQILDNTAEKYANLQPYQYHGSLYGIAPAQRGYLRPVGEWNFEEVTYDGSRITVNLNGTMILDVDLNQIEAPADGRDHPGMRRARGHIGFMGHGDRVEFRNIRIRELN